MVPLLAGGELVGSITIPNYEREDVFTDLPINMLETIASNMGTAIQNVRLFDETQHLLKETEQRATELQIINNIGQTLSEGLDLQSTLERVGDRLRDVLKPERIGITVFDEKIEHIFAHYGYRNGKRDSGETLSLSQIRASMRLSARGGGRSWVVNRNAEKSWRIFGGVNEDEIPKSFAKLPLHAGGKVVGGITLADYEKEDAFADISISMLETIASNIGTAVHNARLLDETQRLLKETEQRATELQIINNIGQTITGELDLNTLIEHVGDKLRETFNVKSIRIAVADTNTGFLISLYMYRNGKRVAFDESWQSKSDKYRSIMRASARGGGRSWVVNTNAEKGWRKFALVIDEEDIPKSFVMLPLLAGREVIGGIYIPNYEKENAFTDFSIRMLEAIASNMGTAIQNVRLFDETKKLFKEAEEARAAAEQANKAKSTFLANMSHELRTPLNAIIGFTRIVKKKADGALPEKQIENLDKVLISSEHLLGLINTVLDIAKIEAGRMDVVPSKFNLSTLTDQCATLATPLLKPNITLEKQADETLGLIFSDQDKIKQIVLNLLSNAAKFTHEGSILLRVEKLNAENVNISVTDSGIGISQEALGRVFEEFQQADNTTTRQYGGTGLGLTISRNLARLLGGDLTAASELGKGSTFTLTLPIQYGRKPASSNPQPDSAQPTESQADDFSTQQNGNRDSLKTILIVEDTELNIHLLTQLLEDDYNLLIAKDGAQGVSMAQQNNPDLILMDISLPIMDGYEATRRIRTTLKDMPIIGLSAHAMSGDEEKAKEAGCDEYMTKPIDEALLIKKLNQYLR
jgi:signal transduction histidine kinase/CheY-like chemotaxis protein